MYLRSGAGGTALCEAVASAASAVEGIVHVLHQRADVLSGVDDGVAVRAVRPGEHGAPAEARLRHGVAETADAVALQRGGDEQRVALAGVLRRRVGEGLLLQRGGTLLGGQQLALETGDGGKGRRSEERR